MSAATAGAGMAPIPITCPVPIGAMPSGRLSRFQRWARSIGPNTEGLVIAVLSARPHPEQGFRTCLGILRLFRGLDPARAEAVSARAIAIGALTYKSLASILAHNLDRAQRQPETAAVIDHPNLRGSRYFH